MPRDTSAMPLPPRTDPPPSGYEVAFGQDAAWRDPAGPARAAAAADREAAARAAVATPSPTAPAQEFDFNYPDNGVLYRPGVAGETPAQPVAEEPSKEPEPPKAIDLMTESGFQIQADPKEVAKRYTEYDRLRNAAAQADALQTWVKQNPDRAAILEKVVRGDPLENILGAAQGDDPDDAQPTPRGHDPRAAAYEARVRALETELESVRNGQNDQQASVMIQQALDSVPFTKAAPKPIRDGIEELAKIDYARHKHEGITFADAVRRRAAQYEKGYREQLQAQLQRPNSPTPLGPDRAARPSVTTRRPSNSGLGLAEYLAQVQRTRPS